VGSPDVPSRTKAVDDAPIVPLRDDLAALDAWGFAFPGPLRDELTALALDGTKTTTAGLFAEMEADGEALAIPGVREVLLDSDERPVAVIETISCSVFRLADVDDRHAIDEGEGYADAAAFRISHERFWNACIDDLRRTIGPDFAIDDNTLVVLQRFKVVERLQAG
jgi:uncharacterized protein YhfF